MRIRYDGEFGSPGVTVVRTGSARGYRVLKSALKRAGLAKEVYASRIRGEKYLHKFPNNLLYARFISIARIPSSVFD